MEVLDKIFLGKQEMHNRVYNWIYTRIRFTNSYEFRSNVNLIKIIFRIGYIVSGVISYIIFLLFLTQKLILKQHLFYGLTFIIMIYIFIITLNSYKKGIFSNYSLMLYYLFEISRVKEKKEIVEYIDCIKREVRRVYKRKSNITNLFEVYSANIIRYLDIEKKIPLIKEFFAKCLDIFKQETLSDLLTEIYKFNKKINKGEDYKIVQEYYEGIFSVKPKNNLFEYLSHLDRVIEQRKLLTRLKLLLGSILKIIEDHPKAIIIILLVFLTVYILIFKPNLFIGLMEILLGNSNNFGWF